MMLFLLLLSLPLAQTYTTHYTTVKIPSPSLGPPSGLPHHTDLTPHILPLPTSSSVTSGILTCGTSHTTCGLYVNEYEKGLTEDINAFFDGILPDDRRKEPGNLGVEYRHNDIEKRPSDEEGWECERERCIKNGWNVNDVKTLEKWRNQEPINANKHIVSVCCGNSVTLPIVDGEVVLGEWQSVVLFDADGPRERNVWFMVMGV